MNLPPTNSDDLIDSREIMARIEELESYIEDSETDGDFVDDSDFEELQALQDLASQGEGSPDWNYGETLIRDTYFSQYAEQLADDIGAVPNSDWPLNCIDWDQAASDLQADYFDVDFDGITYWIRG
jgi:hypothetical protein